MAVRYTFPRRATLRRNLFIPLADGTRLAAQIWLPEDAERDPVPAILEYLPYRLQDGTAERDALTHAYFAGHGYAGVRVDLRGSGNSDGVLKGEYLEQEQNDALEAIAWLARQPWCTGAVGMIGISWGGFNGLQIAARRPEALQAVVSLCSTDDRYADDIHCMGGCLLTDKLAWGATMLSIHSTPPDPAAVGERWREMWLERLQGSGLWLFEWHEHLRRDAFYRHGSICEDYGAIRCPVYLVGGWADGYSNAIFRMLERLEVPRKGLIGPWAHKYPHLATPGPRIGFLQECLRWWDHWLKGIDTGIMDEPMLRVWLQDPVAPDPACAERPGRWVAETGWPSPRIRPRTWVLGRHRLQAGGAKADGEPRSNCSPQTVGLAAGKWCPYGLDADLASDQREEAGGSLVFDSLPLTAPVEVLGAPIADLDLSADRPRAIVAVVLSEVLPGGAATRICYGLLNLTHRESHETPAPLEPGKRYRIGVRLNEAGHRFAAGNRIRLAISTGYWPIAWPAPEPVTLTIFTGASTLDLPVRPARGEDAALRPFPPPEWAAPLRQTLRREGSHRAAVTRDLLDGTVTQERSADDGLKHIEDIDWDWGINVERRMTIRPDDPLSARSEIRWVRQYGRGAWRVRIESGAAMSVTQDAFRITAVLRAFEGDVEVHSERWERQLPRDHV